MDRVIVVRLRRHSPQADHDHRKGLDKGGQSGRNLGENRLFAGDGPRSGVILARDEDISHSDIAGEPVIRSLTVRDRDRVLEAEAEPGTAGRPGRPAKGKARLHRGPAAEVRTCLSQLGTTLRTA